MDDHFRDFARSLEREIAKYNVDESEDLDKLQASQMNRLVALETRFRNLLTESDEGNKVYERFVDFICVERGNILTARPYFRERQETFTSGISPALKERKAKALHRFRFNWHFVSFAMENGAEQIEGCSDVSAQIASIRKELTEMNMPLAISRAHIFWARNSRAHLSYMDLIQIATEGLINAIDKFTPPYTTVFRAVAIGRMLGNFIEETSRTQIHFYPVDRRKIYRANKAVARYRGEEIDYEKVAKYVNRGIEDERHRTTAAEISELLAAVSHYSADTYSLLAPEDDSEESAASSGPAADEEMRPDSQFEELESRHVVAEGIKRLSLFSQKLLAMKGVVL